MQGKVLQGHVFEPFRIGRDTDRLWQLVIEDMRPTITSRLLYICARFGQNTHLLDPQTIVDRPPSSEGELESTLVAARALASGDSVGASLWITFACAVAYRIAPVAIATAVEVNVRPPLTRWIFVAIPE